MNRTYKAGMEDGFSNRAAFGAEGDDASRGAPVESAAEKSNNTLRAYREIRRRVLDNEMPAGSQFLEQELAELLDMSRTPVREALIRLAEERLVEVRPRHGIRVLPTTSDDLHEIYELLTELEAFAVRRVAEAGIRTEVKIAISGAIEEMESAQRANDLRRWAAAGRSIHEIIFAATGNSRLMDFARILADQSHQSRMQAVDKFGATPDISQCHRDVLDAMVHQNPAEAERLKREHFSALGRKLVQFARDREASKY